MQIAYPIQDKIKYTISKRVRAMVSFGNENLFISKR